MSHKFVVIDEIMEQMEAAKSGIVPGSVTQAVVSGVQNVPSNIKQHSIGGVASTSYTTFPLSPIVKNCCLDKSYLNFEFEVNFDMTFKGLTASKRYLIPFYLGLRDNASIFNQLQILIENSAIWTTTYQREESVLSYNSLPETEIRGNNQYASIEKMREGKYCPMKRYLVDVDVSDGNTDKKVYINQHFKITIDINRLTPLLSNIHFTTPHMGNLRLKVFMQEFEKCLFICPDYNYFAYTTPSGVDTPTKISEILNQPFLNQYWQFYPFYKFTNEITKYQIPFYAYNITDSKLEQPTSVIISNPTNPDKTKQDFMTFDNGGIAEIVQTCFDIKDEEYQRLTDYFASLGSVIIPSQTWSTNVFNNSQIASGGTFPGTQIGNIGGYNLDFVSVWTHPTQHPCAFTNEYLKDVQLILDGRPINPIPYPYINDKAVVDTTQAIIDTDHEEINHDYISSLTVFNETDNNKYIDHPLTYYYGNGGANLVDKTSASINRNYIANPNTFALNFSTNLPDAFHSGACILENSNRQAVLRYIAQSSIDDNPNFKTTDGTKWLNDSFPMIINHAGDTVVSGFSAFCDCCIVLTYDPARQTCFDGQLSWAAPYA